MAKLDYDTTVAIMAAAIYAAWADSPSASDCSKAVWRTNAILEARAIVAEVKRTQPTEAKETTHE